MIARAKQCRPQLLREAIADRLSTEAFEDLSSHIDSCEHCRHELELLSGGAQWQSRVHQCLGSSFMHGEEVFDDADEPNDEWQAFLEPSDDPTKLGRIGKYEVESLVGRGGFGIVFKALDTELSRYVAIKVLSTPVASSAAARKRFIREAQAAAAVVHDHVVPIYDVDTSRKVPFLVMPFFPGPSLQERLDAEGTLGLEEVLRIALQTARGLAAAHGQGLIHRDIKPANILLENGVQRVRISDFGLARAVDDATQTQSGFIAGTPTYMAPEQARGESLDARADLFSLGSVMYAMCAGHPPFRAETTLAVLRRICDDRPRDVREHNPSVPDWLWQIIEQLLAKSPGDRFQSAEELADLLGSWLAHVQQPKSVPPNFITRKRGGAGARGSGGARIAYGVGTTVALVLLSWYVAAQFPISKDRDPDARPNANPTQPTKVSETSPLRSFSWPGFSPDQIQTELDLAWQETVNAESRLPPAARLPRYTAADEIHQLDVQLQLLEQEFEPRH